MNESQRSQLRELIAYCRAHVETPLGIISNSMLNDLAALSGRQRTWKKLHPAGMTACGHATNNRHLVLELCDQAEKVLDLRPLLVLVP